MATVSQKKERMLLAASLAKKTHFDKAESECLLNMFDYHYKREFPNRGMDKKTLIDRPAFRHILAFYFDITDDVILDRIFKAFDKDNDSYVNYHEWVKGLSIILRGTLDEKKQFCFEVYDMNQDGFISRDEMFHLLKSCMVKQPADEDPEEGVKDIVDNALKKLDKDHDGRISFPDYNEAVQEDDLLLEYLGQCLPSEKCLESFNTLFKDNKRKDFGDYEKLEPEIGRSNSGRNQQDSFTEDIFD